MTIHTPAHTASVWLRHGNEWENHRNHHIHIHCNRYSYSRMNNVFIFCSLSFWFSIYIMQLCKLAFTLSILCVFIFFFCTMVIGLLNSNFKSRFFTLQASNLREYVTHDIIIIYIRESSHTQTYIHENFLVKIPILT